MPDYIKCGTCSKFNSRCGVFASKEEEDAYYSQVDMTRELGACMPSDDGKYWPMFPDEDCALKIEYRTAEKELNASEQLTADLVRQSL